VAREHEPSWLRRCQDLTVQRDALAALGVAHERIYVDHGLTGTTATGLFSVARSTVYRALARARAT